MKNDYNALTALMMGESASATRQQMPKITYGPMNEVYLGGSAVAGIQSVMDQIVQVLTDDPSTIMARNPLTKKLEDEVQKAFGFKKVMIEWKSTGGVQVIWANPLIANYGMEKFSHLKDQSFKQGTHSKGFYDKDHKARIYIYMDTVAVTDFNCNAREMTAILLHEIGHSFDYTPARLVSDVYNIINMLISITMGRKAISTLTKAAKQQYGDTEAGAVVGYFTDIIDKASEAMMIKRIAMIPISAIPFSKEVYMKISMIREYILSYMPPVQPLAKALKTTKARVVKFFTAISMPWQIGNMVKGFFNTLASPMSILFMPITLLFSILGKQPEIYADSFAATYGYAEDLAFGLHKIARGNTIPNVSKDVQIFSGFYDLVYCQMEFNSLISSGSRHPSTMKRVRRMIDKLERDLKTDNVDPDLRAELQLQLKNLQKAYDHIIDLDETNYTFISAMFTKLMAAYYDSSIGQVFDFDSSFAE